MPVPSDAPNDFPVAMLPSKKYDIVYMITKMGYLYLFDIHSAKALYRARVALSLIHI